MSQETLRENLSIFFRTSVLYKQKNETSFLRRKRSNVPDIHVFNYICMEYVYIWFNTFHQVQYIHIVRGRAWRVTKSDECHAGVQIIDYSRQCIESLSIIPSENPNLM